MERYNIYIVILCIFAVTSLVEVWIEMIYCRWKIHSNPVTSLVEVWIEITSHKKTLRCPRVTSLVEVWIEIVTRPSIIITIKSLPLWKCGLKYMYFETT